MNDLNRRKRAVCAIPLSVIEHALRLQPNQVLMAISQTHDDMRNGVVEIIVEGDGLDGHFLTTGPVVEGVAKFYGDTGQPELWVVPPESAGIPPEPDQKDGKPQP